MRAGGTPRRGVAEYWNGSIPFVKIEDMTASSGEIFSTAESITEKGLAESSAWVVPPGAVLLAMYASIGEVAINRIPVATNQAIMAITADPSRVDGTYLQYALKHSARRLVTHNIQTTQRNVNKAIVERFQVPVPPLSEQRAIAGALHSVEAAIAATSRVIVEARELKVGLLRRFFEEVPGTATASLGDVCERPQYGVTTAADSRGRGPKLLRITDLHDGAVEWGSVPRCRESDRDLKRYELSSGDIVVARIGATTGKSYLLADPPESTVFASYLIRVQPKPTLLPEYLSLFMQSESYWQQIDENKGGRLKLGINIPVLSALRLPLPPVQSQKIIAAELVPVDAKIRLEMERRRILVELFDSLLDELLTGRLRLKHGASDG